MVGAAAAAGGGLGGQLTGMAGTLGGQVWNSTFFVYPNNSLIRAGGVAGAVNAGNGGNGLDTLMAVPGAAIVPAAGFVPHGFMSGGSGGGGGAYGTLANGGQGGEGGFPRAGGGAGGNCDATFTGGAGGAGGDGYLIIIEQL